MTQGYDPNTLAPALRYGDTVVLVPDGWNALVAYAGAEDARPWAEILDNVTGTPPNLDACKWRLEPPSRHDVPKKVKQFLKKTVWDEGKNLPVPDIPEKNVDMEIQVHEFLDENDLSRENTYNVVRELFDFLVMLGDELGANTAEMERVRGKELQYGSALDLVHVLTGTVMTIGKDRAIEHESKRVFMHPDGTNRSNFAVRPAYKTYSNGLSVASGDLVQFESRGTISGARLSLHMSNLESLAKDPDIVRRQMMSDHPYIIGGQEVNAMAPRDGLLPTCFRVLLCQSFENTFRIDGILRAGDIFTFYHKQTGGYLHYDSEMSDKPILYESGRVSKQARKKCQWLWQVESCQLYKGGYEIEAHAHSRARYRIKHLITGMYLMNREGDIVVSKDATGPDSHFFFRPFEKNTESHVFDRDDLVFVRSTEGEYMMQAEPPDLKSSFDTYHTTTKKEIRSRVKHVGMKRTEMLPDSDAVQFSPVSSRAVKAVIEVQRQISNLEDLEEQLELLPDCAPGPSFNPKHDLQQINKAANQARSSSTGFLDKLVEFKGANGVVEIFGNCLRLWKKRLPN